MGGIEFVIRGGVRNKPLKVVQVYAPTAANDDSEGKPGRDTLAVWASKMGGYRMAAMVETYKLCDNTCLEKK